jgi:hypothetical protein
MSIRCRQTPRPPEAEVSGGDAKTHAAVGANADVTGGEDCGADGRADVVFGIVGRVEGGAATGDIGKGSPKVGQNLKLGECGAGE